MDNIIDVSIPAAEVVDKHPEVLDVLLSLSTLALMRNTVGEKVAQTRVGKLGGNSLWIRLCVRLKQMVTK